MNCINVLYIRNKVIFFSHDVYISYEKYIEKFYVIWILGYECSFVKDLLYIMDVWMDWRRFMALHSSDDFVIALNGCTPLPPVEKHSMPGCCALGGWGGCVATNKVWNRLWYLHQILCINLFLLHNLFNHFNLWKKGNILMWIKQHINTNILLFSVYIFEWVNLNIY